ncbi:MAG: class I SAM-dependent methyltransferase [Desulfobulbaceae bacterium]|nr:class I SAM-dependent methyltransferase [Desulfobulbaceae bacterium]
MAKDNHLGTGEYDPEKYWGARAKSSEGSPLAAVCVFGALQSENESASKVQIRAIRKILKGLDLEGKTVLEFGCGVGRLIPLFKKVRSRWHGVDISDDMLSMARNVHGYAELTKIINHKIPYANLSMDFAYSVTVIHHNPYGDQEKIASELSRILKKGGYLLILEDLGEKGQFNMFPRSRESWIKLFEQNGLTLYKQSGLRYWIIRDLLLTLKGVLYKNFKRYSPASEEVIGKKEPVDQKKSMNGAFRKMTGWLDLILDPYIYPLVPESSQTAAVMLFYKAP